MNEQHDAQEQQASNNESAAPKIIEEPTGKQNAAHDEHTPKSFLKEWRDLPLDRRIESGIAILGLIVGIFVAYVALNQLSTMREQTDAMKKQTEAMGKQTDAMERLQASFWRRTVKKERKECHHAYPDRSINLGPNIRTAVRNIAVCQSVTNSTLAQGSLLFSSPRLAWGFILGLYTDQ